MADEHALVTQRFLDLLREFLVFTIPAYIAEGKTRLAGDVALAVSTRGAQGRPVTLSLYDERWAAVRQMLVNKTRDDPDFFSVVGLTELRLLETLLTGALSVACAGIVSEFDALHARMPSAPKWKSVHDQLDFLLAGVFVHGSQAETEAARTLLRRVEAYLDGGG